jgi:hypothetical protein
LCGWCGARGPRRLHLFVKPAGVVHDRPRTIPIRLSSNFTPHPTTFTPPYLRIGRVTPTGGPPPPGRNEAGGGSRRQAPPYFSYSFHQPDSLHPLDLHTTLQNFAGGAEMGARPPGAGSLHRAGCEDGRAVRRQAPHNSYPLYHQRQRLPATNAETCDPTARLHRNLSHSLCSKYSFILLMN